MSKAQHSTPGRPRAELGEEAHDAWRYLSERIHGANPGLWARDCLVDGIDGLEEAQATFPSGPNGLEDWTRERLTGTGWKRLRDSLRQRRRKVGPPTRRPETVTISRKTALKLQATARARGWTLDETVASALEALEDGAQ